MISTVKLKGILGNINAQYANSSHDDLPSQVKVLQLKASPKTLAGLAARVGMVHYISTVVGATIVGLWKGTTAQRIYFLSRFFLVPDIETRRIIGNELGRANLEEKHIHFVITADVSFEELPEASLLQ
jgi:hypothetical protein